MSQTDLTEMEKFGLNPLVNKIWDLHFLETDSKSDIPPVFMSVTQAIASVSFFFKRQFSAIFMFITPPAKTIFLQKHYFNVQSFLQSIQS